MIDTGDQLLIFSSVALLLLLGWRTVRLLALIQQKEYRFDRWLLFWQSPEGKRELWKVLPARSDLTRRGFRRPKLTLRLLTVALTLAALLWLLLAAIAFQMVLQLEALPLDSALNFTSSLWMGVLGLLLLLLSLPVWISLATLPSVLAAELVTSQALSTAQQKISGKARVIGITGSYGKTSTKQLLAAVLSSEDRVFSTERSFNTCFSVARSISEKYRGEPLAVIEYAAYTKGEIAKLARWIPPDTAVITGLTEQHLGLFGSLDAIITAKSELVAALPPNGTVFYNSDDPGAEQIVLRAGRSDLAVIAYSGLALAPTVDELGRLRVTVPAGLLSASTEKKAAVGSKDSARVRSLGKKMSVQTKLVGKQYAATVAAAVAVAQKFGVLDRNLVSSLESFEPTDNFISTYVLPSGTQVIDDGGSCNPAGFLAACELAVSLEKRPRWLLFSGVVDLAEEESRIHRELAIAAQPIFERVLYVGAAGKTAFFEVFGERLVDDQAEIQSLLQELPARGLLVIEGRMPGWLQPYLSKLSAAAGLQQNDREAA
jgi:UDP-N-acetylmuramoyl-tripeptide--D-alanyl-D-alanine ligase